MKQTHMVENSADNDEEGDEDDGEDGDHDAGESSPEPKRKRKSAPRG